MSATRSVLSRLLVGGLVAGLLALPSAASAQPPTGPDHSDALPIVFVHGLAGSGAQYQAQALRFASNGYPAERIRAFEYSTASTLAVIGATLGTQNTPLTNFIDALRDEFGVDQVVLVGHSLGTSVSNQFLSNAGRAALVAKYIGIDGSSNTSTCLTTPGLECMGVFAGPSGNVGGNNVNLAPQTHVEVASSAESFAAQYEFITGQPPVTTLVLPEPPGQVSIGGRAVNFPANSGTEGASLELWRVHPNTGHRTSDLPIAVTTIGGDGAWGPWRVNGQHSYELALSRDGQVVAHYYFQPFLRSHQLLRLLASPPDSAITANTNVGDDHAAAVILRNREWWTTHSSGNNDILNVSTSGDAGPVNVFTNVTANNVLGVHLHDAAATPGDSTLALLPYFPTQPFQTGVDVFMPATSPPDGTITFANAPRGDTSRWQVIATPNWPSTGHRISVYFNDYVQDVNSWGECQRAKPSPC